MFRSADRPLWLFNRPNLTCYLLFHWQSSWFFLAILVLLCSYNYLIECCLSHEVLMATTPDKSSGKIGRKFVFLFQRFSVHFLRHQLSVNGLSHDGFIHRTVNVFVDKLRGYLVVFWIDRCLKKPPSRRSHTDRKVHQRHGNPEWLIKPS